MATASGLATTDLSTQLKQADQQIEQTLTIVRQTGKRDTLPSSLEPIRANLESLHRQLIASGQGADASFAILRAGDCLRILNRGSEALDHYQQAIEEGRQAKRVDVQARAWLGTERAQRMGLRDYGAAGEAVRQANALLTNEPELWPIQADVWGEQSDLEVAQGEPQRALQTLGKVIMLCTEHHDDGRLWINLFGRAGVYHDLADADRERFISLPIDSAQAWKANEEMAASVRRQLQQAIADTEEGLAVAERAGATGMAQMFAPQVTLRQQLAQQFEKIYGSKRAARELVVKQGSDGAKRREPMMVKANGELIQADLLEPALPVVDKTQQQQFAAAMLQAIHEEARPESYTWRRRLIEGQLQESQGHITEALESYREAARMVGKERRTLKDERLRATFVTEKMQLYDRLILNLLQLKEYGEAFSWMEQSRSRAMLDMLATLHVDFPQPAERKLYADLLAARSRAASAESPEEENAAAGQQDAVLSRIRQQAPKLLQLVESEPVELVEMQRELSRTPCDLVYYILHAGRVVLWHIGPTRIDVRAYYASASQVQGLANDVAASAAGYGDFDTQAAADLYTYLAKPALQVMETRHLVIVPPPELGGLPFQALFDRDKQQFFGEQVALSYGPSASTIARLAPARSLQAARILITVGPNLSTEGSEADAIARQYPHSTILRGPKATLPMMAEELKGTNALHIAAHGEYQEADPMLSFIRLSDGAGGTHRASAAEMLSLPLQGVAAVTLASCSTGKAKVTASGESYGFLRSLLYAGAQSVVLPLWEVSDEGAAFWFASFYINAQNQDLPEAARMAIVAARRHPTYGAHPRFWPRIKSLGAKKWWKPWVWLILMGAWMADSQTMTVTESVIEVLNVQPGGTARSQEFSLEAGEIFRATAKPGGELQPALFIYEAEAGLVGKNDEDSSVDGFTWRAPKSGHYRVVLYSNSDTAVDYRLSRLPPESVRGAEQTGEAPLIRVPVYFATNRTVITSSPVLFGADPAANGKVQFGKIQVSIPLEHQMGQLELPSILRLEFSADPKRHFVAGTSQLLDGPAFYQELAALSSRSDEHDALVFIHGYNTSFEDASLRTAQLAYDLGFKGPAILYTWPSQGKLQDYLKDQRNADVSAAPLRALLTGLSQQARIQRIHVIAHSMGNRVLAAALSRGGDLQANVREIALLAPDIDAALFQELAAQFPKGIGPITLYASSRDSALLASQQLAGYPRLGQGGKNMAVIVGVDSVDASAVDTSGLGMGHQYYADSRTILSDLYYFFKGEPASKRFSLRRSPNGEYWIFSP